MWLYVCNLLQLSDADEQVLPPFPAPKEPAGSQPSQPSNNSGTQDTGPILPVPVGVRPTLAKYRLLINPRTFKRILMEYPKKV